MQWWHQRQAVQLSAQAAKIRDGLLQELFAIRRSLEVLSEGNVEISIEHRRDWLKKIEWLYQHFEQISNYLSPPYLEESLPLAVQYVVEQWRTHDPQLRIELDLPAQWSSKSFEHNRVVLTTLDEFLQLSVLNFSDTGFLWISLNSQASEGVLTVQVSCPDQPTLVSFLALTDLRCLIQSFQLLTLGECFYQKNELDVMWCFRWQQQ